MSRRQRGRWPSSARAGSELVRITVDRARVGARRAAYPRPARAMGVDVPLIGDFHYNGHTLLADYPACAEALAKYRINPGNVGFKEKQDRNFAMMIETALRIRQAGAHRRQLGLARPGAADAAHGSRTPRSPTPREARAVMHEAVVQSGLLSAERAEELGLGRDRIVISAKCSEVQDLIAVYRAARPSAATTRCISASPKRAWARKASSPRPRHSPFSCRRASATRSASR